VAIDNWMNNYLYLLVPFQQDWDSALWRSRAQKSSWTGRSHSTNIDILGWIIHLACYTSVYKQISTCDRLIFSQNISLCEILGQATYRTWWKHIDPFCPTFSCVLYSSLFPLQWPSSTLFQPDSLTSMFTESIWEHLEWQAHPSALGFPEPQCHPQAGYWICCPSPIRHHSWLDYSTHPSSQANFRCPKCFQVHYLHHFRLDNCRFVWLGGHLILDFFL